MAGVELDLASVGLVIGEVGSAERRRDRVIECLGRHVTGLFDLALHIVETRQADLDGRCVRRASRDGRVGAGRAWVATQLELRIAGNHERSDVMGVGRQDVVGDRERAREVVGGVTQSGRFDPHAEIGGVERQRLVDCPLRLQVGPDVARLTAASQIQLAQEREVGSVRVDSHPALVRANQTAELAVVELGRVAVGPRPSRCDSVGCRRPTDVAHRDDDRGQCGQDDKMPLHHTSPSSRFQLPGRPGPPEEPGTGVSRVD